MRQDGTANQLVVIGANHVSSTAPVRDRLFVTEERTAGVLGRLRESGLAQAVLLSTCARTEVQAAAADPERAARAVTAVLADEAGLDPDMLAPQLYVRSGGDAVRHIFSVVCALDSPVVGEPQVAGQLRASHRRARAEGMTGPELEAVLSAAYGAAKRVRNETPIGEGPVSMAAAAVALAQEIHGDLARAAALLVVGADMGELIAERMLGAGLGRLVVTSPVAAHAERLARRYAGHHAPIDTLSELLSDAEIVITALGTGQYAITRPMIAAALAARRRRPIFLIDAAIPADVHPGVDGLDGAFRYDLDDLERVALQGVASREAAAAAAQAIIESEIDAFLRNEAGRSAGPVVSSLRAHFEAVRAEVLADSRAKTPDGATRLLVGRLLHEPSRVLREMAEAADGGEVEAERLLRRLYGLRRRAPESSGE